MVWYLKKEGKYSRQSMLAFPPLWAVISTESYPSMKDKYQTSYVSSYCPSKKIKLTDTRENDVEEVSDNIW